MGWTQYPRVHCDIASQIIIMKLFYGLCLLVIVYVVGWHQLYGQFLHEAFKRYQYPMLLLSMPNTLLSIYSVKLISEHFDGKIWPNRIFTFSIGMLMFTMLTTFYFNERLTPKTLTLIGLSVLIVVLQVVWK